MKDNVQDPEEYVTVGKFMEPVDAQMAKGLLESAGIECFLQGENANNLIAMAFRVRLQVHHKDEAAAREMLGSEALEAGSGDVDE
jgi:hypothetical protein